MTTDASCAPGEVVAGMVVSPTQDRARVQLHIRCGDDRDGRGLRCGLKRFILGIGVAQRAVAIDDGTSAASGYGGGSEVPAPTTWTRVLNDGMGTVSSVYSTKPVTNKRRMLDVALLREAVDSGMVDLGHCGTDKMVADALTKRMSTYAVRRAACRGIVYGGEALFVIWQLSLLLNTTASSSFRKKRT